MIIDEEIHEVVTSFLEHQSHNMGTALGIQYTRFSKDRMEATMAVGEKTTQPFGYLHGGASVALGESLCSIGGWLNVQADGKTAVGLEINANHVRGVRDGNIVKGFATPLHRGATTQLWKYDIYTEDNKLVCTGRCTLAIIKRP